MANEKLQDLIEALKHQGVEKGEGDAKRIIQEANQKAAEITARAKTEAEAIIANARADAEKEKKRLQSSMEVAASQFVNRLKHVLETELLVIPLQKEIADKLSDPDFLKKLLAGFVENYAKNPNREDIRLLLPADAQEGLLAHAVKIMAQHFGPANAEKIAGRLESGGAKFGFQVDKADGHMRLDFSDEAFLSLFLSFLTPRFREFFKPVKIGEDAKK